ncbi:MAG: hypothetical protein LBI15_02400 [Dysgonamonadaceae bacterium]|jgi:hypothetical protein|nr:hypothetical protein [Dysgonamonadaceae bacterium]
MAHTATLRLKHAALGTYKVLNCNYRFTKPIQQSGEPCGGATGGQIEITVETPAGNDLLLYKWMQGSDTHKDGEIVFEVPDRANLAKKTLVFRKGYCIYLHDSFSSQSDGQMLTQLIISAAEIIILGSGDSCSFKSKNLNKQDDDEN